MKAKVGFNVGFFKIEFDVDFTDRQRENWAQLLSTLRDHRVLSAIAHEEYVGEVVASVARLRQDIFPQAMKNLSATDPLRASYEKMRKAARDFLTSLHNIDRKFLTNRKTNLSEITPIGYQWTFVSALQAMRDVFTTEITENCLIFGLEIPDEFQSGYRLPEHIADEWADEIAALYTKRSR